MDEITELLTQIVAKFGYIGIFIASLVESTFIPIPSEVTIVPAGIMAGRGKLNYWMILLSGSAGVMVGSLINYWLGLKFGRALIEKYGRYLFLKPSFLHKTEVFFNKYGAFAVFYGRLLPGVRHYIAFPAGIAKMKLKPFIIFTAIGGVVWIWILLQIGFMTGVKYQGDKVNSDDIEMAVITLMVLLAVGYIVKIKLFRHHHYHHPDDDKHHQDSHKKKK